MFVDSIVDNSLEIHPVANAILALLADREPEFLEWKDDARSYKGDLKTRTLYNGRERGYVIVATRDVYVTDDGRRFPKAHSVYWLVAFGENRNSDDIFVQVQMTTELTDSFNVVVTTKDFSEESYNKRRLLPYKDIRGAVDLIIDELASFYALGDDALLAFAKKDT